MSTRASRILLGLYGAVILAIIGVANVGGTNAIFHFITVIPFGDKLGHFGLFGVLALLVDLATRHRDTRLWRLRIPTGPAVLFGLVFLEELSQRWMSTRTFDLGDLSADIVGMTLFVGLGRWLAGRRRPEREPECLPSPDSPAL